MKITFSINADSEAVLTNASRKMLAKHGVMGLDWLRDIQWEAQDAYRAIHAEVFQR